MARPGTPTATRDAAGGIYFDGSAYMVLCLRLGIRKVLGICVERTAAKPEVCASTNSTESVCASSKVSDGLALRALRSHCVSVAAASALMLELDWFRQLLSTGSS